MKPAVTSYAYTPEVIRISDHPEYTLPVTILSGQNLAAGAVIGKVTASGKYILSLSAAEDGSETPIAILMEAVDASGGDVVGRAWFAVGADQNKLTFGTGHTADSVRLDLSARGIFLFDSQSL